MGRDPRDLQAHMARYIFCLPWCTNKRVLDAACGVAYGTQIISYVAESVTGLDIHKPSIDYGWQHYPADNISLRYGDVTTMPLVDELFDVVVSFETVEHLTNPDAFISECHRVLKPKGSLLISAPERSGSCWHVRDYSLDDLVDLVSRKFRVRQYWTQGPRLEIVESMMPLWDHPTWIVLAEK
jgi:2-polyprenyl-3-methyl-5-hydroxy-6-metoxy-1,4-benzoquinol methylase